jgi:anti-sigma regulatory factor (Ser/Thr protein kinase)
MAASAGHPSAQMSPPDAAITVGAMPQSARLARRFAAAVLAEHHRQGLADKAVLLTSELVTNALRFSRAASRLELRLNDTRLRVDVVDQDERPPELQTPAPVEENGRGLMLVDKLADRWGWSPADSGKRVWFELDVPSTSAQPVAAV